MVAVDSVTGDAKMHNRLTPLDAVVGGTLAVLGGIVVYVFIVMVWW